ncbi:hypothetical protein WMY93_012223 [Mugilogobius chulae]|uniref:Uncharacterized protein n=1 Tax=Mugilogobius chulae TaxID=88201 RepID=A0AAW0PDQ5_9GOBI
MLENPSGPPLAVRSEPPVFQTNHTSHMVPNSHLSSTLQFPITQNPFSSNFSEALSWQNNKAQRRLV